MAGQQAPKAQVEPAELVAGEAIFFPGAERDKALAELLLLRCGVAGLVGSQVIDQAKLCGQAVKAAFEELNKEADSQV